ncbi:DUF4012 domain-containing protein [Candidatus Woesebacteria bacterium]|nr:DUF4012 domain-containing protein [Candidatus Woesebacteria bacterium]
MPNQSVDITSTNQNIPAMEPSTNDQVSNLSNSPGDKKQLPAKSRLQLNPRKKKLLLGLISILLLLVVSVTAVGFYSYKVVQAMMVEAQGATLLGREVYLAFKAQNLPEASSKIVDLQNKVEGISTRYSQLAFARYIPIAREYYLDGEHGITAAQAGLRAAGASIAAVEPYADVLGFTGEGTFTGGTTEDRLKVILETLDKVSPQLDQITEEMRIVEAELAAIDPEKYPENFRDKPIRSYIQQSQELSSGAVSALTEYRSVLEQLPSVAGGRGERKKYLILFQNDNELRPTGGFLTAYAIVNVENGKVEAEKSDDIYELDQKFKKQEPIPPELGRYLTTEKFWNLRDMNVSPDFKSSMEQFYSNYKGIPGEPESIDGIIAVDTHFLTNIMQVLGPVEVPGYGTFSADNDPRCDCPQIIYILSEIITRPTPYHREDRKGILGPLMRSLLTKAYTAPKQQWPLLFETGFKSLAARHVQMYFLSPDAQAAAETAQAAGRMLPKENSDYLAIINANLGGAKSNLFVTYDVNQTVSAPQNGMITKTIEITYRNNRKADNCNLEAGLLCLNSTLRDWTRIYVPSGSKLVEAQGFTEEPSSYDEQSFTVFDGFFTLEPLGTAKLKLTYQVPYEDTQTYRLHVWKQGGIENYEMLSDVEGGQEKLVIDKDTSYETAF